MACEKLVCVCFYGSDLFVWGVNVLSVFAGGVDIVKRCFIIRQVFMHVTSAFKVHGILFSAVICRAVKILLKLPQPQWIALTRRGSVISMYARMIV